jgi:[ribosomal protein S5]-alanine N-acetyltransferase
MPPVLLRALISEDRPTAAEYAEFTLLTDCSVVGFDRHSRWVERRMRLAQEDPEQLPWLYRAIVRATDDQMVGYISFHRKAPDPDLMQFSEFAAELGYAIAPEFRRQGYAREAASAMMSWAHARNGVRTFFLTISPSNIASLGVAQSLGFSKIDERMDDFDGLEYVMKVDIVHVQKDEAAP